MSSTRHPGSGAGARSALGGAPNGAGVDASTSIDESPTGAIGAVGSALPSHGRGHRFEPGIAHGEKAPVRRGFRRSRGARADGRVRGARSGRRRRGSLAPCPPQERRPPATRPVGPVARSGRTSRPWPGRPWPSSRSAATTRSAWPTSRRPPGSVGAASSGTRAARPTSSGAASGPPPTRSPSPRRQRPRVAAARRLPRRVRRRDGVRRGRPRHDAEPSPPDRRPRRAPGRRVRAARRDGPGAVRLRGPPPTGPRGHARRGGRDAEAIGAASFAALRGWATADGEARAPRRGGRRPGGAGAAWAGRPAPPGRPSRSRTSPRPTPGRRR